MSKDTNLIKTLIFDLDGTILDTIEDLQVAGNLALSKFGFSTYSLDVYKKTLGNGLKRLISDLAPENIGEATLDKLYSEFLNYYDDNFYKTTKPYPEIKNILNILKEKKYHLAVLTNKRQKYANRLIEMHFPNIFEIIIGENDNLPKKPDSIGITLINQKFNTLLTNSLLIGDSLVDLKTSKAASIKFIGVNWGFQKFNSNIINNDTFLIDDPKDLINILKLIEKERK